MADPRLDATVYGAFSYRRAAERRAEIDNLAVLLLAHDGSQFLTAEEKPFETDVERTIPIVLCDFPSGLRHRIASAVHENIQPTKALQYEVPQPLDLADSG